MDETYETDWLAPLEQLISDFGSWAPHLLAAFVVLAVGLMLAWLARAIARGIFRILNLDEKLKDLWLFRVWNRSMHGHKPTDAAASFLFYIVLFAAVLVAIRLLGADAGQTILTSLLGVIPRVVSVMLILFLGSLLAMFFSVLAQIVLASTGVHHPSFWGKVIAWGTFGVTVMFSLEPLGLAGQFLTMTVLILVMAASLAGALAVGLGCKDLAREFIIELLKEDSKDSPR